MVLNDKYRVVHQAASWEEALNSAEAGIEMALTELRKPLAGGTAFTGAGWTQVGTGGKNLSKAQLIRSGEGGNISWTVVSCDSPFSSDNGEPWWRIRAHGYCRIPGGRVSAGSDLDAQLRKLSLNADRYSAQSAPSADSDFQLSAADLQAGPVAHRAVEAIVRPVTAFEMALMGNVSVDFSDQLIQVDSYDSRDPNKSTLGAYDPTKRTWYADIGTNGELINAGNGTVYGTANTNGGIVNGAANIMGNFPGDPNNIRNNFSMPLDEVIAPSVTEEPTSAAYSTATSTASLPGGSVAGVAYDHIIQTGAMYTTVVRLSSLDLQNSTLFIQGIPNTTTDVHIIVTGNITVQGVKGAIIMDTGVRARIFVGGDVSIGGLGLINPNPPLNLQLYGLTRNSTGATNTGSMQISGNGNLSAAIYAPNYDITLNGGGSSGDFFGSIVGNTITMVGHTKVHYDEALGNAGLISNYKIVSWFEDER
jgi:hypothetical protein